MCQRWEEASLRVICNSLPLLSPEKISCFSLLTAHGPEAAIAQIQGCVGDWWLSPWPKTAAGTPRRQGGNSRSIPLVAVMGMEYLLCVLRRNSPGGWRWAVPVGKGLVGAAAETVRLSLQDSAPMEAFSAQGHIPRSLQTSWPSRCAVTISTGCESPQGTLGSFWIAYSCHNSY